MNQRGMSESVQWAVLGTAFLVGLLGLVEAGLVLHARTVVVQAALAGADAQAAWRAAPGQGLQTAREVATAGGLTAVQVDVAVSSTGVTVTVQGDGPTLVGWLTPHVKASTTRPLEAP